MTKLGVIVEAVIILACFSNVKPQESEIIDVESDFSDKWTVTCDEGYGVKPENIDCDEFGGKIEIPPGELNGEEGFWTSCSFLCEFKYEIQPEDVSFKARLFQSDLPADVTFDDTVTEYVYGNGWVEYSKDLDAGSFKTVRLNVYHFAPDTFCALDKIMINGDPSTTTQTSSTISTSSSSATSTQSSSSTTASSSSTGSSSVSSSDSETVTYPSTNESTDDSSTTSHEATSHSSSITSSEESSSVSDYSTGTPTSPSSSSQSSSSTSESSRTTTTITSSTTTQPTGVPPIPSTSSTTSVTPSSSPCVFPNCIPSTTEKDKSPIVAFITGLWGILILSLVGLAVLLLISFCLLKYLCCASTSASAPFLASKKNDDSLNILSENNSPHGSTGELYSFMDRYPYLSTAPSILNSAPSVTILPASSRTTQNIRPRPKSNQTFTYPYRTPENRSYLINGPSPEGIALRTLSPAQSSSTTPIQVLPRYPSSRRNQETFLA